MLVIPAIDLIGGKPVRLQKGDYATSSEVAADALEQALAFQEDGAAFLHMVDLDGARSGKPENAELICKTAAALDIPVEVGGGIRSEEDIRQYLENGITRVILGTRAIEDPAFLCQMASRYPGRIVLGLDCRDGIPAVRGWLESDERKDYLTLARELDGLELAAIIFTDIETDGMQTGPNLDAIRRLQEVTSIPVIASGGVGSIGDIDRLKKTGADGVIVGKALYSGSVDLKEAIDHAQ